MKKMLVVISAAITMALAGPALADVDEGRITEMKSWVITLDRSHQFFTAGDPSMLEKLRVGDRVRVTFTEIEGGEKQIVKVDKILAQ